jgi:hypothetical protein
MGLQDGVPVKPAENKVVFELNMFGVCERERREMGCAGSPGIELL